jgi:hypothetical protein
LGVATHFVLADMIRYPDQPQLRGFFL